MISSKDVWPSITASYASDDRWNLRHERGVVGQHDMQSACSDLICECGFF